MTIVASVHQTVPPHADLPAATPALTQIAARGPQPDQSPPINKAALDWTYCSVPRHCTK
jgi:hypothetical protein